MWRRPYVGALVRPLQFLILVGSALGAGPLLAAELTREAYLARVLETHPSAAAAQAQASAAELEPRRGDLLTLPRVFGEALYANDQSPVLFPDFNGTERLSTRYRLGIESASAFGPTARVFRTGEGQRVLGAALIPLEQQRLDLEAWGGELSLPLWRDAWGRRVRLEREGVEAQGRALRAQAEMERARLLADAERAYLRTARLQRELELRGEQLARSRQLVAWVRERVNLRLLESSDLAQAEAALAARELEAAVTEAELAGVTREFLGLGGYPADRALPALQSVEDLPQPEAPVEAASATRHDVKAAAQAARAEISARELEREELRPDLRLSARYLDFGRTSEITDARRCAGVSNCGQLAVELTLSFPLAFGAVADAAEASRQRALAQGHQAEALALSARAEYARLRSDLDRMGAQVELARRLVRAQERRLEAERRRQRAGRSTTFEILQAEQDHQTARIALVSTISLRFETAAALRLYSAAE